VNRGSLRQFLSADHARLDAALRNGNYEEFREGLLRHISIEQKILFPLVPDWPVLERLHNDHGALAALLVPTPTPAILTAVATILENHNPLEEGADGLYEQCERRLGREAGEIFARIQNVPRVRVAKNIDNEISLKSAQDALRRAGYSIKI
jgi:hypothetical protein